MTSKPPFGGEVVRLGELIRPSSVERCGDRSFPILSITKQDGITFQADKFKKRIASANTNTYKVIPRGKLVQGIHIDEANFGIQDIIDYGVVSPAYKVWDVNSDRVVPEYLAQALRSDYCIDYYRKNLSGTVNRRGRMSNEVFYQLALFLPSLAEQKRRLDVLQHVSALVQCQTRAVEAFDSLVKSRFVEMFGDPKTNSCGWPVKQLGQISDTRLGKMLDKKKQTGSHLFPYLANTNVQWFRFELGNLNQMDFDESDQSEFELRDGDVLATEGGEVGRSAIWHNQLEHCYFQKAVHRIRCHKDCLLPEYLVWAFKMKSELGLFYPYTSKSTIAHLTGKKIKQVPLQLPPLALQCEFADFATRVDKLRVDAQAQKDKLQTLYDSLAQDYFAV